MLKISLSGKAKSGKNTTAEMIASELKLLHSEYVITSFAKKFKETIESWFPGCNTEALYGASELRQENIVCNLSQDLDINATYREACIDLGKLGRKYSPQFWIAHLAEEYRNLGPSVKCFIISDQRFKDEFEWVKRDKYVTIRVKRKNIEEIDDISEKEQDSIPDEEFDHVIINDGSIDDLRKSVKKLISNL